MKRAVGVVVALLLAAGLIWGANFYWQHLRGIGPVLKGPPQDISQLMAKAGEPGKSAPGNSPNTTGFPLKLPRGFNISIFAKDLGAPRVLAQDPGGALLASIPSQGRVVALLDKNKDGIADYMVIVAQGLQRPHGLAFRREGGKTLLYIAEVEQLAVYDYDEKHHRAANKRKIADLPTGGRHWTRTMVFLPPPDGRLLISIGSSCDTCVEKDKRHATVQVTGPMGGGLKPFATGLRNAVFMALHPQTGQVWVTEMGRDFLGDDLPPDEINILEEGKDYGWPYCYGKRIHDDKFDPAGAKKDFCQQTVPSYIDIPAHSAPLGLAFFPEQGWPPEYHHNLLVAYHGSWNRSVPTGYKVVRYKLDAQGKYLGVEDFITGWLTPDGRALGRPVDMVIQNNGVMYISDDKAGVVYRVKYGDSNR